MIGRIPARAGGLAAVLLASLASCAVAAGTASAEVIYNNVPSPLPGNLASYGSEAYSMAEFGGQVSFRGTDRGNPLVTVVMSSWACEEGNWVEQTCSTPHAGEKFDWPVTLNVYEVGPGNSVGAKIATAEKSFKMPYRPSASKYCTGGRWYDATSKECFHGKAFRIKFKLKSTSTAKHAKLTLPATAIIGVSYDTTDHGPRPVGRQHCNETTAGCYYDSLNVAMTTPEASFLQGSDPTEQLYVNSTWNAMYCGSSESLGAFGPTGVCPSYYEGEQPAFEVSSTTP